MMRTTSTAIALATILGLGIASPSFAGDDAAMKDHGVSKSEAMMKAKNFEHYALKNPHKLEGQKVQDYTGRTIGEIEELAQARDSDQLYVVVDTEDFFRSGSSDAAIPLDSFALEDDGVVLMSQGTDLPLGIVDYDETSFKTFEYTGDTTKVDSDEVLD